MPSSEKHRLLSPCSNRRLRCVCSCKACLFLRGKCVHPAHPQFSLDPTAVCTRSTDALGGLREHPGRCPTTCNLYEVLAIANNYVTDPLADKAQHFQEISDGLAGFESEMKSRDSPFRMLADEAIFGTVENFVAAKARTREVVEKN